MIYSQKISLIIAVSLPNLNLSFGYILTFTFKCNAEINVGHI